MKYNIKTPSYCEEALQDALDRAQDAANQQAGLAGLTGRANFLLASVRNTFNRILATIERKNSDYASDANPFKNFESCQRAGISVQSGIFVRFLDKVTRLENLLYGHKDVSVSDETVDDTIDDAIGYLACLKARREYEKNSCGYKLAESKEADPGFSRPWKKSTEFTAGLSQKQIEELRKHDPDGLLKGNRGPGC